MPNLSGFSFKRLSASEAGVSYTPPSIEIPQEEVEYAMAMYEIRSKRDFIKEKSIRELFTAGLEEHASNDRSVLAPVEDRGVSADTLVSSSQRDVDLSKGVVLDVPKNGTGVDLIELEETLKEAKNTISKFRRRKKGD